MKHVLKPFKWFLRWAARRSAKVVAISSYTANELRELVDIPIEVIPYSASLPPASGTVSPSDGRPSILFVGRLVERKGVSVLIEAVGRLQNRDARLVIVGEGPERSRLEALSRQTGVADRVEFRGKVSDAELQRAYQRASAFVLPSVLDTRGDTEGLGVVLLEAMNYGVPVVASRIGGIVDVVADRDSGLLVPAGDPTALAEALDGLFASPDEARRLGEGGRKRLREQFSWDAIVARWDALYRSLR